MEKKILFLCGAPIFDEKSFGANKFQSQPARSIWNYVGKPFPKKIKPNFLMLQEIIKI